MHYMTAPLNRLLVGILPLLPKTLVRRFAQRYVAGESAPLALAVAANLNDRGYGVTLDILGEHVDSAAGAADVTAAYGHLYGEIAAAGLQANISLKPTHLGLDLGAEVCLENLRHVLEAAREHSNFLRLDMESSAHTDDTIQFYRQLHSNYEKVGLVFQAYLKRSAADLADLMSPGLNVRICKGIYREPADIALQDGAAINENFTALLRQGFEGGATMAIATHDQRLIQTARRLIDELQVPPSRFEFQVLYGVPMSGTLEKLLEAGYTVRVYLPFGEAWHDYALRRLKENPAIAGYILRNMLRRN